MTRHILLLVALTIAAWLAGTLTASAQQAEWQLMPGPSAPGGTVDALVIAVSRPDTLYALVRPFASYTSDSSTRLFCSYDAALTWQQVFTFTATMNTLAVDPGNSQILYAGRPDALYRSSDGGLSWTLVYTMATAIAVPSRDLIYTAGRVAPGDLACYDGYFGIARSNDGGISWQMAPVGCATEITVIAGHPADPELVYAGGSTLEGKMPLLLRSRDGGLSWVRLSLTSFYRHRVYSLAIDPTRPALLLASDSDALYRSTDAGDTWEEISGRVQGFPRPPLRLVITAEGTAFAAAMWAWDETPIYRSDDGGESWWASLARLPRGAYALASDPQHPSLLYAGLPDFGIYRSINAGSTWQEHNAGIRTPVPVCDLATVPGHSGLIYAASCQGRGGLFRSEDEGLTWTTVITDTPVLAVAVNPVTPTIAFAGTPSGFYETRDGTKWWRSYDPNLRVEDIVFTRAEPQQAYAVGHDPNGRQGYFLRYYPPLPPYMGGWVGVPIPGAVELLAFAVHPWKPELVYAGGVRQGPWGRAGAVYRSRDGGNMWQEVLGPLHGEVGDLFLDPRWPDILYAGSSIEGLYRSTDGGDSWEQWRDGLAWEATQVYAITADRAGTLYVATGDGVYLWDMSTPSWLPFGLQGQRVWALSLYQYSSSMLLAGTGQGLWSRELPLWQWWFPLAWLPK